MIGSDSGKIVIVEWVAATNSWKRVHEETFGRTGARRIVPGQYLAVDPKGRAIMIGAACTLRLLLSHTRFTPLPPCCRRC